MLWVGIGTTYGYDDEHTVVLLQCCKAQVRAKHQQYTDVAMWCQFYGTVRVFAMPLIECYKYLFDSLVQRE